MSYERARKGCEKCHQYNLRAKDYHLHDANNIMWIIARDHARFNVMQALEAVMQAQQYYDASESGLAFKALAACESCYYFKPIVAELLKIEEPREVQN